MLDLGKGDLLILGERRSGGGLRLGQTDTSSAFVMTDKVEAGFGTTRRLDRDLLNDIVLGFQ